MKQQITKEAQIELSRHIRDYIVSKWGTVKRGAKIMGVSNTMLSMVLNGKRQPPKQLMVALISTGFDEENFNKYYIHRDEPSLDNLSKKELIEFANQQRFLIYQYRDMVKDLLAFNDKIQKVK